VRLAELATAVGARLVGDGDVEIDRVSTLKDAGHGAISFLSNNRYRQYLADTKASAVIVGPQNLADCPTAALVSDDPYLVYARVARHLNPPPPVEAGIHATAWVDPGAVIGEGVSIGPHVSVGAETRIGDGVVIGAGCVIGARVVVGAGSRFAANVTVNDEVLIGERVLLHPGVVLGADGFGLAVDAGVWEKVPQLGRVQIGNDVEIGANTTVDRGALEDTVVGDGVKIDNLVQVAHNVQIGAHTVIAACTGIAGSTSIGKHCSIAGGVGINGHLRIADHVTVTGMSMVVRDIDEPGKYSSGIVATTNRQWRKNLARFNQLDQLAQRIRELEAKVADK